jgi:hypothetical protein
LRLDGELECDFKPLFGVFLLPGWEIEFVSDRECDLEAEQEADACVLDADDLEEDLERRFSFFSSPAFKESPFSASLPPRPAICLSE